MKAHVLYLLLLCLAIPIQTQGQGRATLRRNIKEWGECKNVAITKSNGDVALYGKNGYACYSCPGSLVNALSKLHDRSKLIDDVQLTENGSWLVLYGDNGFQWNDIPYSLEKKLREMNDNEEVITSVTFNDAGDWIVISTEHIAASNPEVYSWIEEGIEEYGALWAACITDDALVLCYSRGYKFMGEVPSGLKSALRESSLDVYRVKIAGTSWFFADKHGHYRYNM